MIISFIITSVLLGVGLAMDAFSVSLANGLNETKMKVGRMAFMAGIFAFFQALMPLIGWVCVHTVLQIFGALERFIPWIAMILLGYIGGKMLIEGIRPSDEENSKKEVSFKDLIIQGVATSIDALSVGFTVAEYNVVSAIMAAIIIAVVTFVICMVGLFLGKKFGTKLAGKAQILGGVILIGIGLEILISSFLG
ncbi:MAG: manganese efflux pump MntP family protein [Clostridia bacterium]|nr:manganese efflux pump MntP family protein [Clostridia bacterium]